MKLTRRCRYYYLKFIRLQGDPKSLALGTAIGVIVGISPTLPLHTLLILTITIITRTSTIAAFFSTIIVCNPLTYIPIYYFSMIMGNLVTPYELNWARIKAVVDTLSSHQGFLYSLREVLNLGYETVIVMVLGGLVLALPFTIASYILSLRLFQQIRKKQRVKSSAYR